MSVNLSEVLKPICPDYIWADLDNKYQLYNLIEWVLNQSGTSSVKIMSFSISEEFIRKILKLKKKGLIQQVELVVDFKASQKTNRLIRFSENVFDQVSYCKTHAKVVLIQSRRADFPGVVITGSQNATRGNRNESIIITNKPAVYLKFSEKYNQIQSIQYGINR
jgi:hypothetical protein